LIFPDPIPEPDSVQDHYDVPPESYWKPEYFQSQSAIYDEVIPITKGLIKFRPGMKGLDIGGGSAFA
jgi:hypothetical protein